MGRPVRGREARSSPTSVLQGAPTGKSFEVDFYTVALWDDGQIVEENLMYDLVTFMQQLGLGG